MVERNLKLEKANKSLYKTSAQQNQQAANKKPISLSQVRHQMMKQKSQEAVSKEQPKEQSKMTPQIKKVTTQQAKKIQQSTNTVQKKTTQEIQSSKANNQEKKDNFAARTMKGFMKFIGADKAEVPPAAETTVALPSPPKEAQTKKIVEKTDSSEKSVLKMIQSKLGITIKASLLNTTDLSLILKKTKILK